MYASLKESEEKMRTEMKEIREAMESAISRKSKEIAQLYFPPFIGLMDKVNLGGGRIPPPPLTHNEH